MPEEKLKVEYVSLSEIKPNEYNPKMMTEKQANDLKKSIEKFGIVDPLIVNSAENRKGFIIGGHQRYRIYQQLKFDKVPVVYVNEPDLEKEKELCVRLSKNTGEFDWDLLANFDLEALKDYGFDSEELDRMLDFSPDEKDDEIPETPSEPKSKLGDVYELPAKCGGFHRILAGDATKREDVEQLMGDKKADMVFCDPPYGMDLKTNFADGMGKKADGMDKKHGSIQFTGGHNYNKVIGDDKDFNPSFIFDLFGYCKEIFLWGADYYSERLLNKNDGSWIVWDKKEQDKDFDFTLSEFELCWSKSKHTRKICRIAWRGVIGLSKEDTKKRIHPTQKPIELCSWFIKKFSKQDDIVLDLFLGSGSTLIACEKTNRINFGCEIDPKYIDVIIQRYVDFTGNKEIIKNGERINW